MVHLPIKRLSTLDCDTPNEMGVFSPITLFRAITPVFASHMVQGTIRYHRIVWCLLKARGRRRNIPPTLGRRYLMDWSRKLRIAWANTEANKLPLYLITEQIKLV